MADVHQLPNLAEVEREAGEWIVRLESEEVSDADRRRFAAWRAAHALHARIYDELRATWQEFTAAGPLVRAVTFGQSMAAAGKPKPSRRWAFAAAAGTALLIGAVSWVALIQRTPEVFQTAIGEHVSLTMPDASIVELNSNSKIRVEYTKQSRLIRLERGEGYFKVTHDTERPFWVVAEGSWVRAVGTAFNVDIRPSGVRVIVSEGVVKVGSDAPLQGAPTETAGESRLAATLSAGEQVDVHGPAVAVRALKPVEVTRSTGWRTGTIYFDNEPLGDVIAEMSRYSATKIVVRDAAINQVPVGGSFQTSADGANTLIAMLKDGLGLTVQRDDNQVTISGPVLEVDTHK